MLMCNTTTYKKVVEEYKFPPVRNWPTFLLALPFEAFTSIVLLPASTKCRPWNVWRLQAWLLVSVKWTHGKTKTRTAEWACHLGRVPMQEESWISYFNQEKKKNKSRDKGTSKSPSKQVSVPCLCLCARVHVSSFAFPPRVMHEVLQTLSSCTYTVVFFKKVSMCAWWWTYACAHFESLCTHVSYLLDLQYTSMPTTKCLKCFLKLWSVSIFASCEHEACVCMADMETSQYQLEIYLYLMSKVKQCLILCDMYVTCLNAAFNQYACAIIHGSCVRALARIRMSVCTHLQKTIQ
jgi:hypothetical protein